MANEAVRREIHFVPTIDEILLDLQGPPYSVNVI